MDLSLEVSPSLLSTGWHKCPEYIFLSNQAIWFTCHFKDPRYGVNTAPLSVVQVGLGIPAGDTVSFGNIVTSMDLQEFIACPQTLYFCATLDKNPSPSRPFKLEGQLTNCVAIDCRGNQISFCYEIFRANSRAFTCFVFSILKCEKICH